MSYVWRPRRGVTITKTEKGLFLFQFYRQLDLERVVERGPWIFDNHLLVLGRVQMGAALSNIPLVHVAFWVQAHNFALRFYDTSSRDLSWKLHWVLPGI